jgi:hypothetical protein
MDGGGWGLGQTEQLLCGDEQVCDGLFYLRELLLGLEERVVSEWVLGEDMADMADMTAMSGQSGRVAEWATWRAWRRRAYILGGSS